MNPIELARWQARGYPRTHRDPVNLALHAVAVPLFWAGLACVGAGIWQVSPAWAAAGLALGLLSLGLQGAGHRRERQPPEPFTSRLNALARITLEQLVTYPRFVLSAVTRGR